jgi:hypothetical protein
MNATDPGTSAGEAHAYFQAIEETFVRLRGAPLLLSPADWRVASGWHTRAIPLEVVRRVLEEVFERRRQRGTRGRISSLRYCAPAVEAAWQEISRLAAAGLTATAAPFEVAPRLAALGGALPADLPQRQEWAERINSLAGSAEEVEQALARLDRELLEKLAAAEGAEDGERASRSLEAALARLGERLPAEELTLARERLARQLLRQRWGLPVLALFSPEAEPGEPSA